MAWWLEETPEKRLRGVYLLAHGDVVALEQLHKSLYISEVRKLADELFHLLLDHILVDDFPKAGVPPSVTEKLKDMIRRAKAGIPEMVEILERGETPTGKEAYEMYLSGTDGFLWGRIMDAVNSDTLRTNLKELSREIRRGKTPTKDILRRAGYGAGSEPTTERMQKFIEGLNEAITDEISAETMYDKLAHEALALRLDDEAVKLRELSAQEHGHWVVLHKMIRTARATTRKALPW